WVHRHIFIDICHHFGYDITKLARVQDGSRVTPAAGGECGSRGRRLVTAVPGRLRENARPVCEELAGLGQGEMQLTPATAASQEARSGAERRRRFAAASAAVERRQASAPL